MSQNILKENIRRGTKQPAEYENMGKPASQFKPRGRSMLTPHAVKYWHHSCTVCQVLCWTKTCVKTLEVKIQNSKVSLEMLLDWPHFMENCRQGAPYQVTQKC